MKEKSMSQLIFRVLKGDITDYVSFMELSAREYVNQYYPDSDIGITLELQRSDISNALVLSITIRYYDVEIIDSSGDCAKIFNTSTLLYTASSDENILHFRFLYGNINDPVTFLPTRSMDSSFESCLMNYLYKNCFYSLDERYCFVYYDN